MPSTSHVFLSDFTVLPVNALQSECSPFLHARQGTTFYSRSKSAIHFCLTFIPATCPTPTSTLLLYFLFSLIMTEKETARFHSIPICFSLPRLSYIHLFYLEYSSLDLCDATRCISTIPLLLLGSFVATAFPLQSLISFYSNIPMQ